MNEPRSNDKTGRPGDGDMRDQLEVLRLMEQYRSQEETPAEPQVPLGRPAEPAPAPEKAAGKPKRSVRQILTGVLYAAIPVAGDPPREILRKIVFLVALLTLIGSCGYIVNDMVIQPTISAGTYGELDNIYHNPQPLTPEEEQYTYPEGIREEFKKLYYANSDICGWFTYTATSSNKWLNINYPVVHTDNNDYYLDHDFYGKKSKNGTLFTDYRCLTGPNGYSRNTIIYGHNMGSGQMFSRLNYLIRNTYNMRSAATFQYNTLYEEQTYKVFAVMVTNTREQEGPIFNYMRTDFSSDADFLQFVAECRARSMYTFADVDVNADDELVMLSTCAPYSKTHVHNSRTVVVARKVREGESASVNTASITENKNCLYPLSYYEEQKLEPHPYYSGEYIITPEGGQTISTASTAPSPSWSLPGGSSSVSRQPGQTAATLPQIPGSSSSALTPGSSSSALAPGGSQTTPRPSGNQTNPPSGQPTTKPTDAGTASPGETTVPTADTTLPAESTSATEPQDTTTPATQPSETEPETSETTAPAPESAESAE